MSKWFKLFFLSILLMPNFVIAKVALQKSVAVKMYKVARKGHGKSIGVIDLVDTSKGMLIIPHLHGLPPGPHGFHVHQNPSCTDNGKAAGGHLDPYHTNKHLGPYNRRGHLGDLPVLIVNKNGKSTKHLIAPKLKVSQVINHSIMIHADGDNYSDSPRPLGGGGARIACGVVK